MILGSVDGGGRADPDSSRSPSEEFEDFRARLTPVVDVEEVPLTAALGRVLDEDLIARFHIPDCDLATTAGYAVWLADLACDAPTTLRVLGEARVGRPFAAHYDENCAVRVEADAPVPEGADAVAAETDCRISNDANSIALPANLAARMRVGENIRRRGADIRAGDVLACAGRRIRPQDLALIVTQGATHIRVRRRLRVRLVTLADVSANVGYADGPKVNTVSMGATGVLRQLECDVDDAGAVSDSLENLVDLIRSSSASQDVIIVAGGGSERVIERIRAALGTLDGADLGQFASRPITVGQVGACTVLGIAGPGASLLASLVLFVRPLLLHRMGAAERVVPAFAVRAGFELSRRPGHGQWLYARLEADLEAGPVARVFRTGSDDMLGAMIGAEGLVELPGDCSRVTPGDRVNYLPLDLLTAA